MLNYVKRINEIEISFFKIAGFSTVTLKISSGAQRHFIKLSLLTDNLLIGHFSKAVIFSVHH